MSRNEIIEEYLIKYLKEYNDTIGVLDIDNRIAIRALMNITNPDTLTDEFYKKQDIYLKSLLEEEESNNNLLDVKNVTVNNKIGICDKGDMTLVKADVIVNCANYTLEGCKELLHDCIDNAVHSFAGLQLRRDMKKIASKYNVTAGSTYISKGYNLPCKYIIHAVLGPISDEPTKEEDELLSKIYYDCLMKAADYNCKSIVFPLMELDGDIYPVSKQARIAYDAVSRYFKDNKDSDLQKVIFNVNGSYAFDIFRKVINNNGSLNNLKLNKKIVIK